MAIIIILIVIITLVTIGAIIIFPNYKGKNNEAHVHNNLTRLLRDYSIIKSPNYKGKSGEAHVHNILTHLPQDYTILDDVVLKTTSGTTQIDHVVVSKYGVFAIETKNYRGEIYGNDNRQQWTQIIVTNVTYRKNWWKTYSYVTKNHFYNPVKQSMSHIYAIKKALNKWPNLKVVPIVVFTGNAVLRNVTSQHHVVYDNHLLATIQNYNVPYLSEEDLNQVVRCLTQKNVRQFVDDKTHVNNVYASKQKYNEKIALGICPQCGGNLVLRNGKYGCFYGCSNYPRCKFTTHYTSKNS